MDSFRDDVMLELVDGSLDSSLFLHANTSFFCARKFHAMGECRRNERPEDQVMARIDLWGIYQDRLAQAANAGSQPTDSTKEFWMVNLSLAELGRWYSWWREAAGRRKCFAEEELGVAIG